MPWDYERGDYLGAEAGVSIANVGDIDGSGVSDFNVGFKDGGYVVPGDSASGLRRTSSILAIGRRSTAIGLMLEPSKFDELKRATMSIYLLRCLSSVCRYIIIIDLYYMRPHKLRAYTESSMV